MPRDLCALSVSVCVCGGGGGGGVVWGEWCGGWGECEWVCMFVPAGDGGNDVSMIQAANVGLGIVGKVS